MCYGNMIQEGHHRDKDGNIINKNDRYEKVCSFGKKERGYRLVEQDLVKGIRETTFDSNTNELATAKNDRRTN